MTENLAAVAAAAQLSVLFIALWVGHMVGDHWVQTSHQVEHKGQSGRAGRRACLAHVYTYTCTQIVALLVVTAATGMHVRPGAFVAGLAVSAGTHYFADWPSCSTATPASSPSTTSVPRDPAATTTAASAPAPTPSTRVGTSGGSWSPPRS